MSEMMHYLTLHVGDYLVETAHLSAAERGAYITLQLHYWKRPGGLPDDDRVLALMAGVSLKQWKWIGPAVKAMFTASNCQDCIFPEGTYKRSLMLPRLDSERERAMAVSAARKAAGNKGLEKRYSQQLPQQ